jgi:hypothetical protein
VVTYCFEELHRLITCTVQGERKGQNISLYYNNNYILESKGKSGGGSVWYVLILDVPDP